MKRWYAVYCRSQQDTRAEMHLRNQSFEIFRPLVQLRRKRGSCYKKVIESMFPRYLFIRLSDLAQCAPVRSTRGVVDFVRKGGLPSQVPDSVVQELQERVDRSNNLVLGPGFQPGETVRILAGPFSGREALFSKRTGEERVMVLLEIMQQSQRLIFSEDLIACV